MRQKYQCGVSCRLAGCVGRDCLIPAELGGWPEARGNIAQAKCNKKQMAFLSHEELSRDNAHTRAKILARFYDYERNKPVVAMFW